MTEWLTTLPAERQRELLERHTAFWQQDTGAGPLLGFAPKSGLFPLNRLKLRYEGRFGPSDITDSMLEADLAIRPPIDLADDLWPEKIPLEPLPWAEGYCGAQVYLSSQAQTVWTKPLEERHLSLHDLSSAVETAWLEKLVWATARNVVAAEGSYLVAESLLRGPADCLEALLGSEQLCLLICDQPETVARMADQLADQIIDLAKAQERALSWFQGGTVNRYGVWGPGTNIVTQADVSQLFSPGHFRDVFLPAYRKMARAFDKVTIHFHSCARRHVDALLSVEEFAAIEWGLDPTGPSLEDMVPVFAKVLERKPMILMNIKNESETEMLLNRLPHNGFCIIQRKDY